MRIVDEIGQPVHVFTFAELKGAAWGVLYERHVGLYYESLGYAVDYRGLRLGFNDRGIDLDCQGPLGRTMVQCKFVNSSLGRQRIEHILYNASAFLAQVYSGTRLRFALVVPSIHRAFGRKEHQRAWAMKRFLRVNEIQTKVRVEIVEVPMEYCNVTVPQGD